MSPDPGEVRTIGCSLQKLIPDAVILADIRTIVERVHKATIHACLLLNLHLRRCLDNDLPIDCFLDGNWIVKAFYEVTEAGDDSRAQRDPGLQDSAALLGDFERTPRAGLKQLFQANANVIATTAHNNIWMHFRRRLLMHVKAHFALPEDIFRTLTKDARRARALNIFRIVDDLCGSSSQFAFTSSEEYHQWIAQERERLGLSDAIGDPSKPFAYQLKARAVHFVRIMRQLSMEREGDGHRPFALFPLRRTMVPRHVRFDKTSFPGALNAMRNERLGRKRKHRDDDPLDFSNVLDFRAAKVSQQWRVKDGFTTDGVCARIQHSVSKAKKGPLSGVPRRGLFAIDELKRVSRIDEWHVVGVDPGKRELVVAVDADDARVSTRYTQRQRLKDTRSRQYAAEAVLERPYDVTSAEEDLSSFNSRTADTSRFMAYCVEVIRTLPLRLAHYGTLPHRHRRWKTYIKLQQSEERLYSRLRGMHTDPRRRMVLAYGAWGAVAGRAGAACNKGNPPCVGVGLLRKLAKRFVVALTPEHYTSKTCCRCHGPCGPHSTLRTNDGKEIRGLRVCQNEGCNLIQNRDRTGAINIGTQFTRLFCGDGPLRPFTDVEVEMTMHRRCLECE